MADNTKELMQNVFGSDSDSEEAPEPAEAAPNQNLSREQLVSQLFGDDDDSSSEDDARGGPIGMGNVPEVAPAAQEAIEAPEVAAPGTLKLPPVPSFRTGADVGEERARVDVMRLPGGVSLAQTGFDADFFSEEEERAMLSSKGKPEDADCLIRWRFSALDPSEVGGKRESNSYVVEWDDGSVTLHVGQRSLLLNGEVLSGVGGAGIVSGVAPGPRLKVAGKYREVETVLARTALGRVASTAEEEDAHDEAVMEGIAPVDARLRLRPANPSDRDLVADVVRSRAEGKREASRMKQRVITVAAKSNLEATKNKRIQATEELARGSARKRNTSKSSSRQRTKPAIIRGEPGVEYDGEDVRALRDSMRHAQRGDLDDEEEDEEDEEEGHGFGHDLSGFIVEDDDEEEEEENDAQETKDDEVSSLNDTRPLKKAGKKRKRLRKRGGSDSEDEDDDPNAAILQAVARIQNDDDDDDVVQNAPPKRRRRDNDDEPLVALDEDDEEEEDAYEFSDDEDEEGGEEDEDDDDDEEEEEN